MHPPILATCAVTREDLRFTSSGHAAPRGLPSALARTSFRQRHVCASRRAGRRDHICHARPHAKRPKGDRGPALQVPGAGLDICGRRPHAARLAARNAEGSLRRPSEVEAQRRSWKDRQRRRQPDAAPKGRGAPVRSSGARVRGSGKAVARAHAHVPRAWLPPPERQPLWARARAGGPVSLRRRR